MVWTYIYVSKSLLRRDWILDLSSYERDAGQANY